MKRALVTGATGFIGSHLTEALASGGAIVRVLARDPARLRWIEGLAGIEVAEGALEDGESLRRAVRGVDVIYHVAGVVKARRRADYFEINVGGTERLLDAALGEAKGLERFVYISSQAAAGPGADFEPVDESAPAAPITPYGESKLAAERSVLKKSPDLPVTLIRPPAVYGPRDTELFHFFKLARRGFIPIPGLGRRMVSIVFVEDLVRGILLAEAHPEGRGRTFYITSSDEEWSRIAKVLRQVMGRGRGIPVPSGILKAAAALSEAAARLARRSATLSRDKALELVQRSWLCSSEQARRTLGYAPRWPLEQGLARTAEWYRNAGWIQG